MQYILGAWSRTGRRRASENLLTDGQMEVAVGVARRDLPLFSYSCISHTLHATDGAVEVLKMEGLHLHFHLPFCVFFLWLVVSAKVVVVAAVAVEVEGAGWGPSGELIEGMRGVQWSSEG